ncbi:MAG: helix-turn-helix transcriptional regulator [Prevotella sp.]|nr:helix-turn-helix transcriptional regulator [Prevotella sp.]
MKIYEAIKEIRLQKGVNQQVIANALNLDVAVVSNIEKGKRDLRVRELEIISSVLEMSVVDLFTYPEKYIKISQQEDEHVEAVLQIKLRKDKKDQVLKLVFGDNNIEILNR